MAKRTGALMVVAALTALVATGAAVRPSASDPVQTVVARRGSLTTTVTGTGRLLPVQSRTYRSPVAGREAEIIFLAPEGTVVQAGELIVQLDVTELQSEIRRLEQELRGAQLDLTSAHSARQDAETSITMLSEGDGALAVEEARARVRLAEVKQTRLRRQYDGMQPLLAKGFLTRDELGRTADELEQADMEVALSRKRADVLVNLTHPREQQNAGVQLAQKSSRMEYLIGRVEQTEQRLDQARELAGRCSIRSEISGLVVHERHVHAGLPRKIRVGDRVGPTQPLVTVPEVERMIVSAFVSETQIHRVKLGLSASIRIEAFPHLRLTGEVARVEKVPTMAAENGLDHRRFEVILDLEKTTAGLQPDMTAVAEIVTSTLDDALLLPIAAVFKQQGSFAALVSGPNGNELRTVQIGQSNDEFVEILSGVREGDRVLLPAIR